MTITPFTVGCDISKAKIDVFDTSTKRYAIIANDAASIERFVSPYAGRDVRFAFEATGFYGNQLRQILARHHIAGVQINPLHGRRFAQSTGRLAKTDRIDAAQLADMAERLGLEETSPWNDEVEELKSLIARRDQLVDMRADERKRVAQTGNDHITASLARVIKTLTGQIDTFDALIAKTIRQNDELHRKEQLLRSIPGIGPAIAAIIIALLPETGSTDRSAIGALAGLAPMARDSGILSAKRSIAGGRPRVRRALYHAAVAVIRSKSRFADRYKEFIKAGKQPKVALIAIARKIITTANAMLKSGDKYA